MSSVTGEYLSLIQFARIHSLYLHQLPVAEALLMGDSTEEGDVGGIEILLSPSTASLHPDIVSGTNGLRSLLSRALLARCRLPGGTNGGPCWQGLEKEISEAADDTPLAAKNGWGGGTLLDEEVGEMPRERRAEKQK